MENIDLPKRLTRLDRIRQLSEEMRQLLQEEWEAGGHASVDSFGMLGEALVSLEQQIPLAAEELTIKAGKSLSD